MQMKLFWIGVGKDDLESEGGHTWINWRLYLRDFTQLLFR